MKVLVAVASKQGATKQIAERIGAVLRDARIDVVVQPVEAVTELDRYDAFVVGSAVRIGHWLEPARRFVREHAEALSQRPVWLFSSGPIGDPPLPEMEALEAPELVASLGARGHVTFPGKLQKGGLGLAERAIVAAVRAPEGDFRPWPEIDAWAAGIATELRTRVLVPA
jgi:menaquinone-dependent protoporphyrinogen oxidase